MRVDFTQLRRMWEMKKTKLLTLGLVAGMAVPLVACGSKGGGGTTVSGEKSFVYGTTAYNEENWDAGLNPHVSYSGWSTLRYGVGETLFKYSDSMEVHPWLAKGYEYIDNTHCKITLRDGVKFSSGRTMDGQAVKECLDDLVAKHDRAPSELNIKNIVAEGNTITIETTAPNPTLVNALADPYGCIIDMKYGQGGVKDASVPSTEFIVAGTGPYVAQTCTPTQIELTKNNEYWGSEKPKIDKLTVKSITDGSTMTAALQSGQIDAAYGLPYASYPTFENSSYNISSVATSRQFFGKMNFQSEVMKDKAVRKAISMGIDKEGFVKTLLGGHGETSVGPFLKSFKFGDNTVKAESFDIEGAKKVLEDAGWKDSDGDGIREKDGKKLTVNWLTYPSRQELPLLAESAQASLKKVGIDVQVNCTANSKEFWKKGQYDIYVSAMVTAPTGDPAYFFNTHALSTSTSNYEKYSNEKLDGLAKELATEFDVGKRSKLATQMSQILLDDNAYVFASHLQMSLVSKSNVKGLVAHPCDYYEITAELDKK